MSPYGPYHVSRLPVRLRQGLPAPFSAYVSYDWCFISLLARLTHFVALMILTSIAIIIGHVIALLFCLAWSFVWLYGTVQLWKSVVTDAGFFGNLYLTSFSLIMSGSACIAIGMGLVGCLKVLESLISGLFGRSTRGYTILD
jgi:hypothetical protein